MTTEELARLHFDHVYKAPMPDIAGWAAASALLHNDRRILVVVEHHYDISGILGDALSFVEIIAPNQVLKVIRASGMQEIRLRNGARIKFQAGDRPGQGLAQDWMVFYVEEDS